MFQFPRLPPPGLCVQPGVTTHHRRRVAPFGNPGISLLDGSPWLIAVIPRPSSARSAKASTVRRSHLTCATPFAGAGCNRPPPTALLQRSIACLEPHTCASQRPCLRPQPQEPPGVSQTLRDNSRSPPANGLSRCEGCCGRISPSVPCQGAPPTPSMAKSRCRR